MKITDKEGKALGLTQASQKVISRGNQVFLEIELFLLAGVGLIPFSFIRSFFYRLSGISIGKRSVINMGARFYNPQGIEIGEDTVIGEGVVLDGRAPLQIGNHVDMASQVMIYNSHHDIHDPGFAAIEETVTIGDYVFIGPRAIILPGVTIGKGAVVAAGAVVTKNVADFEIVGGVPAKSLGERKIKNPTYTLRRKGLFDVLTQLF